MYEHYNLKAENQITQEGVQMLYKFDKNLAVHRPKSTASNHDNYKLANDLT